MLKCLSLCLCIISDERDHGANTVHCFLEIIVTYLKQNFPNVEKINYFSDGAGSRYKNKKNFINLTYHQQDFGVEAV